MRITNYFDLEIPIGDKWVYVMEHIAALDKQITELKAENSALLEALNKVSVQLHPCSCKGFQMTAENTDML
jgi:hypothetical protein